MSCRNSPGMLELVAHIGGMVGDGYTGDQVDSDFQLLDLLQQLHGILTGNSPIASIPVTGLGSTRLPVGTEEPVHSGV